MLKCCVLLRSVAVSLSVVLKDKTRQNIDILNPPHHHHLHLPHRQPHHHCCHKMLQLRRMPTTASVCAAGFSLASPGSSSSSPSPSASAYSSRWSSPSSTSSSSSSSENLQLQEVNLFTVPISECFSHCWQMIRKDCSWQFLWRKTSALICNGNVGNVHKYAPTYSFGYSWQWALMPGHQFYILIENKEESHFILLLPLIMFSLGTRWLAHSLAGNTPPSRENVQRTVFLMVFGKHALEIGNIGKGNMRRGEHSVMDTFSQTP